MPDVAEPARRVENMRAAVADTLAELGDRFSDLVLLAADGRALVSVMERRHPSRVIDVGIAEANLVGVAAGLARGGRRVAVACMAPFLVRRGAEQIRIDVCRPGLDVTLIGIGGGLGYGGLGPTHHAPEDLSVMSAMPGISVYCPADVSDAAWAVREAVSAGGPAYIRLAARDEPAVYPAGGKFSLLKPRFFGTRGGALVVTAGPTIAPALHAVETVRAQGADAGVLALAGVKPFPRSAVIEAAREATAVVTVQDQLTVGGLAGQVAEALVGWWSGRFAALAVDDRQPPALDRDDLFRFYGIDAAAIARTMIATMRNTTE